MASRVLWDKGVAEYIEAARILRTRAVPVELLLAGTPDSGNPASVPPNVIAAAHESGLINALGFVHDMALLLSSVDVAVLPSYREGTPRGLLEAAACGLPIVATDVPGCREVVDPGGNGMLVPPRDGLALADAIQFLAEHGAERVRMGQAGREKAVRHFDEKIVLRETLNVYRELVALA
jgi:glycosyltransferase involved in cell wall biosynthesis